MKPRVASRSASIIEERRVRRQAEIWANQNMNGKVNSSQSGEASPGSGRFSITRPDKWNSIDKHKSVSGTNPTDEPITSGLLVTRSGIWFSSPTSMSDLAICQQLT